MHLGTRYPTEHVGHATNRRKRRNGTGVRERRVRVDTWAPERTRPRHHEVRTRVEDPESSRKLATFLRIETEKLTREGRGTPVILCVGSDRSTGDALGPLVGSLLLENGLDRDRVTGDLSQPVHASNLRRTWAGLLRKRPRDCVIAVDACLGRQDSVGVMTAGRGPLRPGAGVNKDLPAVGDIYLTGTVNVSGFMEYFVLQNTRLSLVVTMAERMATAILQTLGPGASAGSLRYPGT